MTNKDREEMLYYESNRRKSEKTSAKDSAWNEHKTDARPHQRDAVQYDWTGRL